MHACTWCLGIQEGGGGDRKEGKEEWKMESPWHQASPQWIRCLRITILPIGWYNSPNTAVNQFWRLNLLPSALPLRLKRKRSSKWASSSGQDNLGDKQHGSPVLNKGYYLLSFSSSLDYEWNVYISYSLIITRKNSTGTRCQNIPKDKPDINLYFTWESHIKPRRRDFYRSLQELNKMPAPFPVIGKPEFFKTSSVPFSLACSSPIKIFLGEFIIYIQIYLFIWDEAKERLSTEWRAVMNFLWITVITSN